MNEPETPMNPLTPRAAKKLLRSMRPAYLRPVKQTRTFAAYRHTSVEGINPQDAAQRMKEANQ
jgi:hypothetical protein